MSDATKAQEELVVIATITDVAGQPVSTLVPSEAKIVVYNKASKAELNTKEAELNKDGMMEVIHCNNGTFAIEAVDPQIGKGTWTLVEGTTAGVSIVDASAYSTTVTGVKEDTHVVVRWSVTNEKCDDENYVDLKLTNNDCTDIDVDNKASADLDPTRGEVCEGEDVRYVFTLTNSSGVTSEEIKVSIELPEDLLNVTVTADDLGSYKDGVWSVPTMKTTDKPTLTIIGKSNVSSTTLVKQNLSVIATITEVANQTLSPQPTSTATVVVYNTASPAELNMDGLTEVEQCNNGEFTIKAVNPQIGKGTWSFVDDAPEGVIILNVNNFETKVIGVPAKSSVTVRWSVVNGQCDDDNHVDLTLTNNNCTEFELKEYGTAPKVCYGDEALFQFTLQNTSAVEVKNVELQLVLDNGLTLVEATVDDVKFENNKCTISTMGQKQTVVIDVKAKATVNGAKATVKVTKSSGVNVANVSVQQAVTVNDLPQVSFAAPSSTICVDADSKESTNVVVNFTKGTPNFTISYKVGDKEFTDVLVEGTTFPIVEDITGDTNIAITQVIDANQCANTFGNVTHTVNTQKHATLADLSELGEVCEGTELTLTAPKVTDNGATVSNQKWMLNDEEFTTDTKLVYETHNNASLYYSITSSCNGITKEIETDPVTVQVINGNVDFDLTVSADKILAGGEETVVTVVPAEIEADTYTWVVNNKPAQENGLEYADYLYLDTKFVVTASNRCDTKTKEVFVQVTWPTAFTPYNKNGMNETFAKGLPLAIYNRLGIQIFEGQDGWDGIMNKNMGANTMAVPGVYYYAVQLPNGEVKKGTIEIVKF
jgi:uncharacterized repeat protein (TIGR01451 family)